MPTFNQLVRKGRETSAKKPKAPALQRSFNSLKKKSVKEEKLLLRNRRHRLFRDHSTP